jgi:hypothetical protein
LQAFPLGAVSGIDARVLSPRLLANGTPLKFRKTEAKLEIEIPLRSRLRCQRDRVEPLLIKDRAAIRPIYGRLGIVRLANIAVAASAEN